jgi:adenylate cyclase
MERKLAAILCADVHGYSRLMGEDEEATLRTLSAYRKIIDSLIEKHRGRFVNSAGDSVLAEFTSVVEAVTCAGFDSDRA